MPFSAHIITLFPEMFPGPLGESLSGKALKAGIWSLTPYNLRRYGIGPHRNVDDTPAGGGAGMVMRADVVGAALEDVLSCLPPGDPPYQRILLTPSGRRFSQKIAQDIAQAPGVICVCGRFEGIDQRVADIYNLDEISIGDYVLSGGELPAMVLLDAVVRLLPAVMGNADSLSSESFQNGVLEAPQYTRPRLYKGHAIPPVLLSGDHQKIKDWRLEASRKRTHLMRPDLWEKTRKG